MKTSVPLITIALVCFAVVQNTQAVSPPPDGGYPGGNTAEGQNALTSLTTGFYNNAVGIYALLSVTTGSFNTAEGAGALLANTANENTATGAGALLSNTTGDNNTANGTFGLFSNTEGFENTAVGDSALFSNTTGPVNTAIGAFALFNNTEGSANTAIGHSALLFNTTGFDNIAIGAGALLENIDGAQNTAIGDLALRNNTSGTDNTACGGFALSGNTTGDSNTATGLSALESNTEGNYNTANGFAALANNTTGINNTALGNAAGGNIFAADNVICIGANVAGVDVSDTCFIGNIRDVTTQNGDAIAVVIDSAGQLGTANSSRRFKKEIKAMDTASEAILALKPVTFDYKTDKTGTQQFGLIAEEVAQVNPDLVARDKNGDIYTVRYDAVNAMLLNEFLKEHRKNEEQEKTIVELKCGMTALAATVKEQAAHIQKVSAQLAAASPSDAGLEAGKFATGRIRGGGPAPQVVNND